jgi:hypothetical protein
VGRPAQPGRRLTALHRDGFGPAPRFPSPELPPGPSRERSSLPGVAPGRRRAENAGEGADLVYASVHYRLTAEVDSLTLQGSADLQGYGNALANTLYGNAEDNLLNGLAGADARCSKMPTRDRRGLFDRQLPAVGGGGNPGAAGQRRPTVTCLRDFGPPIT